MMRRVARFNKHNNRKRPYRAQRRALNAKRIYAIFSVLHLKVRAGAGASSIGAGYPLPTMPTMPTMPTTPAMTSPNQDFASAMNDALGGWDKAMGLHLLRATADEVVAECEIGPQHGQPHGIVHGGVYSGIVETVASIGAAIYAMARGQSVVGLENHTSFLHAVRAGTLRATARPLTRGRRTQVWEGTITDATGRIAATGRVRLLSLEPDAVLAGEPAKFSAR